jgi:hypothetical protein
MSVILHQITALAVRTLRDLGLVPFLELGLEQH